MTVIEQRFYEIVPKSLMLIAEYLGMLVKILKEDKEDGTEI